MPELFRKGVGRIVYKSRNFVTGKTVKAYIWSPSLVKSSLQTFTELESGIYYLDYDFQNEGTYIGLFLEDSNATTIGIFRVVESLEIIKENVEKILQVQKGRWEIKNDQLIIYEEDGTTVLYKFDLKGEQTKAYSERVPA